MSRKETDEKPDAFFHSLSQDSDRSVGYCHTSAARKVLRSTRRDLGDRVRGRTVAWRSVDGESSPPFVCIDRALLVLPRLLTLFLLSEPTGQSFLVSSVP